MTLSQIITSAIREAGGDGLCNVGLDCGCGLWGLAPCDAPGLGECEIARILTPNDTYYVDGEELFVPLRKEGEE